MASERDEVWGSSERRTLAYGQHPMRSGLDDVQTSYGVDGPFPQYAAEGSAHGPEAVVRARAMDYHLTRQIQEESPYIREEVVEHKIHDYRLYVGIWVIALLSGVSAFLTYSPWHLAITVVAVAFALTCSPGRSRYEE